MKKLALCLSALMLLALLAGCKADTPKAGTASNAPAGTPSPETEAPAGTAEATPEAAVPESAESAAASFRERGYESWQEAYLDALVYDAAYMLAWDWQYKLAEAVPRGNYYLSDLDGDGTPELLTDAFYMDDVSFLVYDWNPEDGTLEQQTLGLLLDADSSSLLLGEGGSRPWYSCAVGTAEMSVENVNGKLMLMPGLGLVGPDYIKLSEDGPFSVAADGQKYTLQYTKYELQNLPALQPVAKGTPLMLLQITDPDTGWVWYYRESCTEDLLAVESHDAIEGSYITGVDFEVLEQEILAGSASVIELGTEENPIFASLPKPDMEPMTVLELIDALGGFDNRPEWADAKALVEGRQ